MSLFKRFFFSTFFFMKKVLILAVSLLAGQSSWAQIRDFQTTRLISTGGAGVASLLSTEAAILNPAVSTFFGGSSFSYQSYRTVLKDDNELRDTLPDKFANQNTAQGYFLADHSGPVKGGVAYIRQKENYFARERMVLHGAAPIGGATSLGISYNYMKDTLPRQFSPRHQIEHQMSLGLVHIIDENTVLGLVVLDPTRTNSGEERIIGGFQYSLSTRIQLIGDLGTQYSKDAKEQYLWRAGAQLNIFSDFFLRVGQFYDNVTKFKGTGWGVSWIGPRFGVEFAQKYSEQFDRGSYIYQDETLVDTSISAILKF
jgi:hypothetical protein